MADEAVERDDGAAAGRRRPGAVEPGPAVAPAAERGIEVGLIGDLACPWCYLGLLRLGRARAMRPGLRVRLTWRPFLLDPYLPPGGVDWRAYVRWKFGGDEAAARVLARVARAGLEEDGVRLAFDRIARVPNTVTAHGLALEAAADAGAATGRTEAALDGLFRALFVEGRDIGDRDELAAIGAAAGLDDDAVGRALDGRRTATAVIRSDRTLRRLGVSGVPVYVFGCRDAVSGAQPPEVLRGLLDLAAAPPGPVGGPPPAPA